MILLYHTTCPTTIFLFPFVDYNILGQVKELGTSTLLKVIEKNQVGPTTMWLTVTLAGVDQNRTYHCITKGVCTKLAYLPHILLGMSQGIAVLESK
jgi:hypothetical protein